MTTYYVRTDGNNGNAGTANTAGGAWADLGYAVTQAVIDGDIIYVKSGTYTLTTATPGAGGPVVFPNHIRLFVEGFETTPDDLAAFPIIDCGAIASVTVITLDGQYNTSLQTIRKVKVTNDSSSASIIGFASTNAFTGDLCEFCEADNLATGFNTFKMYIKRSKASNCTLGFNVRSGVDFCEADSCDLGFDIIGSSTCTFSIAKFGVVGFESNVYDNPGLRFCTAYGNSSHGFDLQSFDMASASDCVSYGNGGYGFKTLDVYQRLFNSAAGNNTLGDYQHTLPLWQNNITISDNPFVNPDGGDFELNNSITGGALLKGAGLGIPGQRNNRDIGAVQSSIPNIGSPSGFQNIFGGGQNLEWGFPGRVLTDTIHQINASGEYLTLNFYVPKSGTVNSVAFTIDTVTTAQDLDIGIYVTNNDGTPGASYGGMAVGQLTGAYAAGVHEVTLATPASVTKGDIISVKIDFSSTVGDILILSSLNYDDNGKNGFPSTGLYTGALTLSKNNPMILLGYSDSTYPAILGCTPPTTATGTLTSLDDDGSGVEAVGMKFRVPFACRINGGGVGHIREFGTTDTMRLELRDGSVSGSEGALLATSENLAANIHASLNLEVQYQFITDYELQPNTDYRLLIRPTGGRTANIWIAGRRDLGNAAHMEAIFNTDSMYTEFDGVTWTDVPTRFMDVWLLFDAVNVGTSSPQISAGYVPRMRS